MELRQLRYFVTVAEAGGFGRAADRLHIVQSAVSQQIARLERELGVRLFDRAGRRVGLTDGGERLLSEARAVLAAAERTRAVATELAAESAGVVAGSGLVRLGTVHGPGDRVYRALGELAVVAPELRVRLRRLNPADRLAAVRSGELDAALVRALPATPHLDLLPVWRDPLHVALPAAHPLAGKTALRLDELAELPLRLAPRAENPPFHDLIREACTGFEPPEGPPFTGLAETLAEIAAAPPSWTVFYEVSGRPSFPGVAIRPLLGPELITSLAVPPGPPNAATRHLLTALGRAA